MAVLVSVSIAFVWFGLDREWFQRPGAWREEIDLRYLAPFETSHWFTVIPSNASNGKRLVLEVRRTARSGDSGYTIDASPIGNINPKDVRSIHEMQVPGSRSVSPFDPAKMRTLSVGIRRFDLGASGGGTGNKENQFYIQMKRGDQQWSQDISRDGFFHGKVSSWFVSHRSIWSNDQLKLMRITTQEAGELFEYEFVVVQRRLPTYLD